MGICASKSDQPVTVAEGTKIEKTIHQRNKKPDAGKGSIKIKSKPKSSGSKLSETVDESKATNVSPQEAARIAAQKRLDQNKEKDSKTELGKKLASERGKSQKTHVMEQIESQKIAKANQSLVYD